jgi:hypothetical protein
MNVFLTLLPILLTVGFLGLAGWIIYRLVSRKKG